MTCVIASYFVSFPSNALIEVFKTSSAVLRETDSWGLLLLPGVCPWILTLVLHHPSPSLCDWTGSSAATGKVLIQGNTWPHYCWWHFSLCLQDVNSNNDKITLFFFPVILQYNMLQEKGKAAESCNGTESTGFWEHLPESFPLSE